MNLSPLFAAAGPIVDAAGLYLLIFLHDFGRYAVWSLAVWLVLWRFLRKSLASRKIRVATPPAAQLRREFAASTRTAAVFACGGLLIVLGDRAGVMRIYEGAAERGWAWFALSLGLLIVLHDAWFYWTHRLIHHPRLFPRLHRTHHRSNNPSPFAAYSFDLGEAAVNAAFLPLIAMVLPVSFPAIGLFMLHMIARNVIGHAGYELLPARRDGRPLFDFLTSVTHHDLHHAQAGWNYGLYFTWWDRLCGTEHPLYHEKFAAAVRKPLDGSAVLALRAPAARLAAIGLVPLVVAGLALQGRARAAPDSAAAIAAVSGDWGTQGMGAVVRLGPCAETPEKLCGRMIWSWDPGVAERSGEGPMLGGLVWTGARFEEGWLANPEDGKTYRGAITPGAAGELRLTGCAFVFCRSEIWRRVEEIPGCRAPGDEAGAGAGGAAIAAKAAREIDP
jgi:sterol desaturase/sphingolipid hydroxylase (fatty acid hydroxylase superfamily)/uncharacterized protein (DUF2147 family)